MDDKQRRKLWRKWGDDNERQHAEWKERGYQYPPPPSIPLPAECEDMRCGAKTRAGTPCKRKDIYRSGRCKLHGGLSTGPRTPEGKAISALNAIGPSADG